MSLQLDESRRLTGANLLWDKPGAIVDVFISDFAKQEVALCWQKWAHQCLSDFGWSNQETIFRLHEEGANLAISAPMDALYTACEVAELAWDCCAAEMQGEALPDWKDRLEELKSELTEEVNPTLLALERAAKSNGVSCLMDDDDVSLGMGPTVQVWPIEKTPEPDDVDWSRFKDVPRAFVTGTNGKSTTVRLSAEIAKAAGFNAGVTSTDFIRVGEDIIDHGDYSGPGGARMLLRDSRTEMAFLEIARGGILRRGLPLARVDAALVTNIASDHLGQYGVNTVEALAQTKFVVARGLDAEGVLVVNADDSLVIEQAMNSGKTLCWFSLDEENSVLQGHIKKGGRAVFVRDDQLLYHHEGKFDDLGNVNEFPMTFAGTARHNIQNALGAIGLSRALGIPFEAISQGLRSFSSDSQDNPGRGNQYEINGVKIILDFAHNEHSMRAVVEMASRLKANKRIALFGHGGDRADSDIRNLTHAVADLNASHYILTELEDYLRGRELGEIPLLVNEYLAERQVDSQQIHVAANPLDGTRLAMQLADPGDLLLLFVLDQRDDVHAYLEELS